MNNKEFKEYLTNRAFNLAKRTITLGDKLPQKRTIWIITDQLIRAITSIGANIIEAQAASSKLDFINFLTHALKSGNESKFWFTLLKEIVPELKNEIETLQKETDEIVKILGSSIAKMKGKKL